MKTHFFIMQRLTEDFLDNIDDRSEIGTEEVQIQDEDSKSPEDYPYVLRFSISNLYFNQKNLLVMIRRAMETVWIKSSSVLVDVEKQNRHEVSVGFEHDFRSIRDIFKFLGICSQALPVGGDVLYILDTEHNDHKQTGSRSIMIGNMSIYMNFNKKGILRIPTKTASTYVHSVRQNFDIAAMLLKDEYKIRAAELIEECYSCNVFQRMITYVLSRLMYNYRQKVMLMGRYIPKALKGHTIDISKLVSSKTIEFVYCKNGQWKNSYKKSLDSDIFMEVIRQNGPVLTIDDFKFTMSC